MFPDDVIQYTRARFPDLASEEFEVSLLEKGGSGRKFYRIQAPSGPTMIAVKYHPEKEENRHYAEIADYLDRSDVNVPHIFLHDHEEGLIWMQDLGGRDLWSFRNEPWATRRPLYERALRQGFLLHTSATEQWDGVHPRFEIEFNEQLYLWEQNYFLEHCLCGVFGLSEADARAAVDAPAVRGLAARLAAEPRVLVHRDFQSQNVIIHGGEAWVIDFQGMRPGLAQYDLASLLYDPYVELTDAERDHLLGFYKTLSADAADAAFDDVFHMCAAQRLMQALGAYGFLGIKREKPEFLSHIPAARRSLRAVAACVPGLGDFAALLEELPA
ncbi:MAG: phosphotransferase [Terrimicrobiaceae bacterium]|nr:phosphotransferase [Terrimicrobiaceae bacterium]